MDTPQKVDFCIKRYAVRKVNIRPYAVLRLQRDSNEFWSCNTPKKKILDKPFFVVVVCRA